MARIKVMDEQAEAPPAPPPPPPVDLEAKEFDFGSFLGDGFFSDFTLIVGEKRYKVHKLILSSMCDFFKIMLMGAWSETGQNEMTFHFPDPLNVFPKVLQFLYTNKISFTNSEIPAIVALSEQLQIEALKQAVGSKLLELVTPDNAFEVMSGALEYPESDFIVDICTRVLAENYAYLEDSILDLPMPFFERVVKQERLCLPNESVLFESLLKKFERAAADGDPVPERIQLELMNLVSFRDMSAAGLRKALHWPLATPELRDRIVQGLWERTQAVSSGKRLPPVHKKSLPRYVPPSVAAAAAAGPSYTALWDPKRHHKMASVKKHGVRVWKSGDFPASCRFRDPLPASGMYYVEIMFNRSGQLKGSGMGCCYYVGVVRDKGKTIQWTDSLGESATNWSNAWVLHDNNGPTNSTERKHKGASFPYGMGYGFGDKIGMLIDMDTHAIGFAVNGKSFGVAFKNLPAAPLLYPAITIYNDRVYCDIRTPKSVPPKLLSAMLKLRAKKGLAEAEPVLVGPGDATAPAMPAAAAAAQ